MSRFQEKYLYRLLIENGFSFLGNGRFGNKEIYDAVKLKYGEFCDDNYLCKDNCNKGANQPEWKHIVRITLLKMKNKGKGINSSGIYGFYDFNL